MSEEITSISLRKDLKRRAKEALESSAFPEDLQEVSL